MEKLEMIFDCKKIQNKNTFTKKVKEQNNAVMDVRTPIQYRDGTFFNAPNVSLRNFFPEYLRLRKKHNKIILIGSRDDMDSLRASVKYAFSLSPPDKKKTALSYVIYEEIKEQGGV